MAEIRHKITLVVRPTGVYQSFCANGLVWLASPFIATGMRQPRLVLANQNGPVRDGNLRTGPDHKRNEVRHG